MRTINTLGVLSLASAALCAVLVSACSGDSTSSNSGGSGGSSVGTGGTTDTGTGGDLFGSGGSGNETGATGGTTGVSSGGANDGGLKDGGSVATGGKSGTGGTGVVDAAVLDGSSKDGATTDAASNDAGKHCGNGVVDPGEDCDPGSSTLQGCTPSCHWLCVPGATGDAFCDDHLLCNGVEKCGSDHACTPGTTVANGTSCGGGNVCKSGLCASSSCGDGLVTSPEECDDGNQVNGDGCDTNCTFSCVSTDSTRNCSSLQTACVNAVSCNDTSHTCATPTNKADNTVCGAHNYCKTGACVAATCGNGTTEPTEACDDGNKTNGDGCNNDCTFSCTAAQDCGTAPSCEKETCTAHVCSAVSDSTKDDTSCGTNKVCKAGACVNRCGNGVVDSGEACDDGNQTNGDGCNNDCTFTCTTPSTDCKGALAPCNKWTCDSTSHLCASAVDPTDADKTTTCGSGLVCNSAGACVNECGNGITDNGEQCDDGNNTNGDGCNNNCKFSCTAATVGTDCTGSAGTCQVWSCGAATHQCTATSATDGTSCGTGQVCKTGVCGTSCGNHVVDAGEACDDGNKVNGDGCDNNCQFSCVNPATDCTAVPCKTLSCSAGHVCQSATDASQNDKACGSGLVCSAGACINSCGNGLVDAADGEQCDDGAGNGTLGDGCQSNCQFTCQPANCPDANPCNGTESCQIVSGKSGELCVAGTPPATGTACGGGNICLGNACVASTCGDGFVDAGKGEECDFGSGNNLTGSGCEPNCTFSCHGTSCDDGDSCNGTETCNADTGPNGKGGQKCAAGTNLAQCTTCTGGLCNNAGVCVAASCGDGCVSGTEQCEPPNTATCDATCMNQCDVDGSWASLLTLNVTWKATTFVKASSGKNTISVASLITTTGSGTTNTVLPCSIVVPNFTPALGTAIYTRFPTSLFENNYLPAAAMTASFSNLKPGATYATTSPFTSLLGLAAPVTGTWPAGLVATDPESDGHPGVTAESNAPTAALGATADHLYLAIQQATALSGKLTDCSHLSGAATVSAEDVDVLGCHVGTGTCNATQLKFLTDNTPSYIPGTATFTATKMSTAGTCANVLTQLGISVQP